MNFSQVQITRVKDYWNERPCNIRHSTATVGTKEYFDDVEARKYFVEYHIPGYVSRSQRKGLFEHELSSIFHIKPYRCLRCDYRHFRFRPASGHAHGHPAH